MARVLLLTTEPLPLPGLPTTGAGLRAWGLGEGLRAKGLDVTLMMPSNALASYGGGQTAAERPQLPENVRIFDRPRVREAVRDFAPDSLVLQHWGMAAELGEVDCPLAIDLAGPHLLERRLWGSADPEADLADKLDALRRADFLTASGQRQRLYFLPYLALAGWPIEAAADPLPPIPFCWQAAAKPAPARADRLVYGGFFLPWQDPTACLDAALAAMDRTGRGELLFVGGTHPTLDVSRGRFQSLLNRLQAHPRVRLMEPMAFDRYQALLAEGGVALDLMARNAERELAFTTRTVVYLATGLPVIHDNYSELGDLIERGGAGWAISPDRPDAIQALIERILTGEEPVAERAEAAHALAARSLDPAATIAPLAEWCKNPTHREGKMTARLGFEERDRRLRETDMALGAVQSQLDTLRGKRWVRWGMGLTSGRGLGSMLARWPMAALAAAIGLALIPVFLINDLVAKLSRRN